MVCLTNGKSHDNMWFAAIDWMNQRTHTQPVTADVEFIIHYVISLMRSSTAKFVEEHFICNKLTLISTSSFSSTFFLLTGPICALHSPHDSSNVRERLQFPEIHLCTAAVERVHFLCSVYELLRAELQEETQPGGWNHQNHRRHGCGHEKGQIRMGRIFLVLWKDFTVTLIW